MSCFSQRPRSIRLCGEKTICITLQKFQSMLFKGWSTTRLQSQLKVPWLVQKMLSAISGLSHGVGTCAPQQGAAKLTLNVKNGIIEEALIETIGCWAWSAICRDGRWNPHRKNYLEALNTDLVLADAINVAMREIFLQFVYGRTQSAFSEDGLEISCCIRRFRSNPAQQVGTNYSTAAKRRPLPRTRGGYDDSLHLMTTAKWLVTSISTSGKMMKAINQGVPIMKRPILLRRDLWSLRRSRDHD